VSTFRTIIVIPARMRSSRLIGKALVDLNGVPAIERCLEQTLAVEHSDLSVLATSLAPENDCIADCTLGGRVEVVRGPEEDVLERFLLAADRYEPEIVLRITGDNPLVSYELAGFLIQEHLQSGADVTYLAPGAPLGVGSEVYSINALRRLRGYLPTTGSSEYLILYFLNNPELFRLNRVLPPEEYRQDWRLTLDSAEDLALLEQFFTTVDVGREAVSWQAVVEFFRTHPDAAEINVTYEQRYEADKALAERLRVETTIRSI
jgi:spore coat polysaccharide biosynthesis protein SpsF